MQVNKTLISDGMNFVRHRNSGNGAARSGNPHWRRVTEPRARTAKYVFHFDVQGSVAKSTHAGIPWLRYIRQHAKDVNVRQRRNRCNRECGVSVNPPIVTKAWRRITLR